MREPSPVYYPHELLGFSLGYHPISRVCMGAETVQWKGTVQKPHTLVLEF